MTPEESRQFFHFLHLLHQIDWAFLGEFLIILAILLTLKTSLELLEVKDYFHFWVYLFVTFRRLLGLLPIVLIIRAIFRHQDIDSLPRHFWPIWFGFLILSKTIGIEVNQQLEARGEKKIEL